MSVTRREPCPQCRDKGDDRSGNNLCIFDNGSKHCYRCQYHENDNKAVANVRKDNRALINPFPSEAIPHRGISLATAEKHGVFRMSWTNGPVTVFPLGPHCQKVISDDKVIFMTGEASKAKPQFTHEHKKLVITEGEYDWLSISQALGSQYDVVSLINGADSATSFATNFKSDLDQYDEIYLSFDNDDPGQRAVDSFINAYGYGKLKNVVFELKDANDMLKAGKLDSLKTAFKQAQTCRPDCVMRMSEIPDDFFDEVQPLAYETGFIALDYYLGGGLRKGELTMVAAGSGCGKSTLCTNLLYNLMRTNPDLKIVDIKLETKQVANAKGYAAIHFNKKYRTLKEDSNALTDEEKREFRNVFSNLYINKHFGSLESGNLLRLLEYYAEVEKVDFILLDHITLAISGMPSSREGERKDIDILMTRIRELIARTGVGFICVSQLNNSGKPGDLAWEEGRRVTRNNFRGSNSLQHLADNIIGVEGNLIDPEIKDLRWLRVLKTRDGEEQEVVADTYTIDRDTRKIILKLGRVK